MPEVFVSYSRRDADFGKRLHKRLTETGRDVWMDWEDIPPTADWWAEIRHGIETADNFVLIMSPDSMASPVCHMEILTAINYGKRIVPLFYREPDPDNSFEMAVQRTQDDEIVRGLLANRDPLKLAKENWGTLAHLNWVFFNDEHDFDEKFADLEVIIDTDLDHAKMHTRLLNRALEWDDSNRERMRLLRGRDIDDAEQWLAYATRKQPEPTALQSEYILASRRVYRNTRRMILGAVILTFSVVLGYTFFTLRGQAAAAQAEAQQQAAFAATSDALYNEAVAARSTAEHSATLAAVARATAEYSAAEANSLILAHEAIVSFERGENDLASALVLEAVKMDTPPLLALDTLALVAFGDDAYREFDGFNSSVYSVDIHPAGKLAALGLTDGSVVLLELETDEVIWAGVGHTDWVTGVAFAPDGETMISASDDETLRVWDVETGEVLAVLAGHTDFINTLAISPDGTIAVSGSWDNTALVWEIETGEIIVKIEHADEVVSVGFSPDGQSVYTGSIDGDVRRFIWEAGSELRFPRLQSVTSIAVAPDGLRGLIAYTEGTLGKMTLFDFVQGGNLERKYIGHRDEITKVAFNPTGDRAISASVDNTLILWDVETGNPLRTFVGHTGAIWDIAVSPDGEFVLSTADDDTLRLWRVGTQADLVRLITSQEIVRELSCDERLLFNVLPLCDDSVEAPLTNTPVPAS